jgi:hypothetical protein
MGDMAPLPAPWVHPSAPARPNTAAATGAGGYTPNHAHYAAARNCVQQQAFVKNQGMEGGVNVTLKYPNANGKWFVLPVCLLFFDMEVLSRVNLCHFEGLL